MTEGQRAKITQLEPDSIWRVPDGSYFVVRREDSRLWLEVVEPKPTSSLAFDVSTDV